MAFGNLKPKKIIPNQLDSLKNATKLYQSLDGEVGASLYRAHVKYLENRDELIKLHKNKYVHVTETEIVVLESINNRPETVGILYQVGKEISKTETAYYSCYLNVNYP